MDRSVRGGCGLMLGGAMDVSETTACWLEITCGGGESVRRREAVEKGRAGARLGLGGLSAGRGGEERIEGGVEEGEGISEPKSEPEIRTARGLGDDFPLGAAAPRPLPIRPVLPPGVSIHPHTRAATTSFRAAMPGRTNVQTTPGPRVANTVAPFLEAHRARVGASGST